MMVMKMDKGLDTGPVALTARGRDRPEHDGRRVARQTDACRRQGDRRSDGKARSRRPAADAAAAEGVLYAAKIDKGETRIDFSRDARDVHNHIRGLSPFPGAWIEVEIGRKPERVKVLGSELCGRARSGRRSADGSAGYRLRVRSGSADQIAEGRLASPLQRRSFLRGTPLAHGTRLA